MDKQTDGRSEFPCILENSAPFGLLLCLIQYCHCNVNGQGKGTADLVLPLRDWFQLIEKAINMNYRHDHL